MSKILDPDYRQKGWNRSKFAPKNRNLSITQLATLYSIVIICAVYAIPLILKELQPYLWSIQGITIGFLVWSFIFGWIGMRIRTKEWKRIQKEIAKEETQHKSDDIQQTKKRQSKITPLNKLSASEFEHEIAWMFNVLSPIKAVVVGGSGDGGVDIELYQSGKLVGIVQCKKYARDRILQPDHVRALYATKIQLNVGRAYLVTTARVSSKTQKEAQNLEIIIMDGASLDIQYQKAKSKV